MTVDYRYVFITGVALVLVAVAIFFWSRTEEGGWRLTG